MPVVLRARFFYCLSNSLERAEQNAVISHANKFQALDFFAGSGLATYALQDFFDIIWANDICSKKADIYIANHHSQKLNEMTSREAKGLNVGKKIFMLKDIVSVEGKRLPKASLSWASFPCQDLSLAGSLKGIHAERSGLVWQWLRIMDEMPERPGVLVAENVAGLLSAKNGEYYRTLHKALTDRGYKAGAVMIDASYWLPQSRPRIFIIAVKNTIETSELESPEFQWVHTHAVINASHGLENFIRWKLPKPPKRDKNLADIVEFDAPIDNREASKRTISLIPKRHREKLEQYISQLKVVPGYKRTRECQVLELRFDGIAGCLRTPKGGSSRQWLVLKSNEEFASRLLTVREAARLMGAPDTYKLPGTYNDGYQAMGDAVAVPVVRYLAENLLVPLAERS